ncbi:hypothetical protein [Pararhodonellum marinum]|uniref:hypothetical protein n=1 Tax=Pararhodonellum marinum TaxID=2755358 RepID=UPI00188DD737|nr:hypothetical protein [Pararhodonellum marinum]
MKNKTKLIMANVFALIAVISILAISNLLGLEIGNGSNSLGIKAALLLIPQTGFLYFYWRSYRTALSKQMA